MQCVAELWEILTCELLSIAKWIDLLSSVFSLDLALLLFLFYFLAFFYPRFFLKFLSFDVFSELSGQIFLISFKPKNTATETLFIYTISEIAWITGENPCAVPKSNLRWVLFPDVFGDYTIILFYVSFISPGLHPK